MTWARERRSFAREAFEGTRPSRFLREVPAELVEPLSDARFGIKARTSWENAVNSVGSVERFLRERGREPRKLAGGGLRLGVPPRGSGRWKLGAQVRHPKFGLGTILNCEGEGEDAKLTVSFPGYGQKKFVERYAALEKA